MPATRIMSVWVLGDEDRELWTDEPPPILPRIGEYITILKGPGRAAEVEGKVVDVRWFITPMAHPSNSYMSVQIHIKEEQEEATNADPQP